MVPMNFPFNAEKAAEAAAILLSLETKESTVLKLTKLMYLIERESFARRDAPIFGGEYFSLPHGPIPIESYHLMKNEGHGENQKKWNTLIGERRERKYISVRKRFTEPCSLSQSEVKIIYAIHSEHASKTAWELRDWCHANIPEYEEVNAGRRVIRLKSLMEAVGSNSIVVREKMEVAMFFKNVFTS